MSILKRTRTRILNFTMGRRGEARLREEMDTHLAWETEENLRAGMDPTEARRHASVKFGPVEAIRESYHAEKGLPLIETLLQDCRFAIRMLLKSPAFTTVVLVTLALGIGANAAIFSLVNAVMLGNLPVADPKSLVRLGDTNQCCVGLGDMRDGSYALFSTETYTFLKNNVPEFQELAAMQAGFSFRPVVVRREYSDETPRSVMGEFVSGNYFSTFGLQAAAGRLLEDRDNSRGAPMTAVMSYQTWNALYHRDASVVGSTMFVNTKPVTVIGIAPRNYYGDRLLSTPPEFYLPIESMPVVANVTYVNESEMQWLYLIGRTRPGVSMARLQQKVNGLLRQKLAGTPHYMSAQGKVSLTSVHTVLTPAGGGVQAMQEEYNSHLQLLMGAAGLVLLIACANIANLLLVRGMARKAEMNMRTALGAGRARIVRQLLTESLLLAGCGGLAGLAVAYAGTRMLLALAFPGEAHVPIQASPSPQVLAFACGVSLLTGVLFGIAPAWIASRTEPVEALRSGMRSTSGGATLLQRSLVVFQAALSLVLLVGAGLFVESLSKLQHIDLKLDAANRYIVHINAQTAGYSQREVGELYRTLEQRFHALPGVDKVGISSYTPMEDNNNGYSVQAAGKPDLHVSASYIKANAQYFDSVGTRVVLGRGLTEEDTATTTPVAVVNENFVKKLFAAGENPIGHHFGSNAASSQDWEIVGVAENTAYQDARRSDHMMYFVPLMQRPPSDTSPIESDEDMYVGAIVLETHQPIPEMEEEARRTLAAINPNLSVMKFQTFAAQIADRFNDERLLARLTMLFGGLALLLAAIGMYGITAYGVARRTKEIGIRMALGAQRGKVTSMVLGGALGQALLGLAVGVPAALLGFHWVASQLYEIKSPDAAVLGGAMLTLGGAAFLAGFIPARRAASVDPARALRNE